MRLGPVSQNLHVSQAAPAAKSAPAQKPNHTEAEQAEPHTINDEAPESLPPCQEVEDLEELFPGIAEGLSPAYLNFSEHLPRAMESPSILSMEQSAPGGLNLKRIPPVPVQRITSDPILGSSLSKLESHIENLDADLHIKNLLRTGLHREDLLAALCCEELRNESCAWESLRDWVANAGLVPSTSVVESLAQTLLRETELLDSFSRYSEQYFCLKYLHGIAHQAKQVLKRLFGTSFQDIPLRLRVIAGEKNNAGYEWVQGEARLTLQLSERHRGSRGGLEHQTSTGPFSQRFLFRRGLIDLVSFIHEYAHAAFDRALGGPVEISLSKVGRALSEGFAVLAELAALHHLSGLPETALLEGDRQALSERRRQRIAWLQEGMSQGPSSLQMPYMEGTELFSTLFRQGGFPAVFEALEQLSLARCNSTKRNERAYLEARPQPGQVWNLLKKP